MLIYEMCQNWAVNHSDAHMYVVFCEDLGKTGEMMHFKKTAQWKNDNYEV